ncbi:hypothetical protein ADINL_3023 [Nitrincola lacisaponensis]|uniref:Uncharacterized protein n=1 Tax=Nitrincola lacisaponensis TaxID=267850 RepID=A0A063XWI5_9GAMM|nr:hypothetical protein [Nitrincola lacisaponensis]KDE38568.1 hypothetical protein ADINL_3023 [Nitrincola lacisaponensis]
MQQDKHRTRKIRNLLGILVSAFFAVVGVAGFQRTQDPMLLLAFLLLAVLSFGLISLIFRWVDRLLDVLDRQEPK